MCNIFLDVFKFDPQYVENEEKFRSLSKEMLGESSGSSDSGSGSDDEDESEEDDDNKEEKDGMY